MSITEEMNQLPLEDLAKIGLYKDGKLLLEQEDLDALLTGRRTQLISLRDLKADGFEIDQLDAKLSVKPDWDHKLVLKIHPIYKEAKVHPLLNEHEAQVLSSGQIDTLQKIYDKDGQRKTYAFEYDAETREFVSYDPEKMIVPETVNGESLTAAQKDAFRNGEIVTLADGTEFQHRASERSGLRADRAALIVSVLLDGGISYLLIRGIKALLDRPQRDAETEGYLKALSEIEQKLKERTEAGVAGQRRDDQIEQRNKVGR